MNRNLFFLQTFILFPLPSPTRCALWHSFGKRGQHSALKRKEASTEHCKKKVIHCHQTKKADTKQGQPKVQFRNRPAQFSAPKRLLKPIGEILGSCKSPIKTKTKKFHKMQRRFCHLIWQFLPYFFRLLLFCHIDRN